MRAVTVTASLLVVLVGVTAQDQTTPKLSWKDRAKLEYQQRYNKYILHKKIAEDENAITDSLSGTGADNNAIPLSGSGIGTRSGAPEVVAAPAAPTAPPPPPPTTSRPTTRPPPPPPPSTRPTPPPSTRPPPPPTTRPPLPPTTRPPPPTPSTTTFIPPPPPSTTTFRPPPPPSTTFRTAPPTTTTFRPPPPPTTTFRPPPPPPPTTTRAAVRPVFTTSTTTRRPAAVLGVRGAFPEQSSVSGTFQTGGLPQSSSGGGFASSSATAFSSGGVAGGSSTSNAGTYSPGGLATGTFSFSAGGASSSSGSSVGAGGSTSSSATGPVKKSPVALLGQVVQGIVRPITSILPAPLGPRGSNPGLVGGLVTSVFDGLDGGIRAIYPGTLWCGAGNVARSEDEVGVFRSTDKCCRQHDNCPDSIAAGATKHGLRNTGTFTRSHCDCDEAFYSCLRADRKSLVSVKVATTYFNLLRPRCFREVTSCAGGNKSNCTTSYRWFTNRLF